VVGLLYINPLESKSPIEAILALKERVYDHERYTLEEYLTVLAQNIWKFKSRGITIEGETLEEKCESCLKQLIELGLINVVH
jgi:hypothetical protein